MHSGKLMIA